MRGSSLCQAPALQLGPGRQQRAPRQALCPWWGVGRAGEEHTHTHTAEKVKMIPESEEDCERIREGIIGWRQGSFRKNLRARRSGQPSGGPRYPHPVCMRGRRWLRLSWGRGLPAQAAAESTGPNRLRRSSWEEQWWPWGAGGHGDLGKTGQGARSQEGLQGQSKTPGFYSK